MKGLSTKAYPLLYSQPFEQPQTGVEVATSDEKLKLAHGATKSWEINYSELKMLETVGEGSFGTVHRAIFRHHEVAVKQLKNKIDQKEVCRYNICCVLIFVQLLNFETEVSVLSTLRPHGNVASQYFNTLLLFLIQISIHRSMCISSMHCVGVCWWR
jgi:hypothetical protein